MLTPKRKNQDLQHPKEVNARRNCTRRLIETLFSQVKVLFGLEQPRARSLWDILSWVIAKIMH